MSILGKPIILYTYFYLIQNFANGYRQALPHLVECASYGKQKKLARSPFSICTMVFDRPTVKEKLLFRQNMSMLVPNAYQDHKSTNQVWLPSILRRSRTCFILFFHRCSLVLTASFGVFDGWLPLGHSRHTGHSVDRQGTSASQPPPPCGLLYPEGPVTTHHTVGLSGSYPQLYPVYRGCNLYGGRVWTLGRGGGKCGA